jgi:hypothetical protein
MMLTFSSFLSHWIFRATFIGPAAASNEIQHAIGGEWQGRQEILDHPGDEQMDVQQVASSTRAKRHAVTVVGVHLGLSYKVLRPG